MSEPQKTLYLIDGHAQIFRAYFAIRGGMSSPVTGEPTHAVFAFAGMLLKLFEQFRPEYAAMVIDTPGKTFRDELYAEYKKNREPPPDDFAPQVERIFQMTRFFGIPIIGQTGAEADDIIATITHRVLRDPSYAEVNIRVVSKDKDLEQLLCDRVTMFDIHTDTTIDATMLKANKGITPQQVVHMLALMGDSVDNVPGVVGVGPKTAAALIQEFGSIDGIYANIDQIKGKRRENLEKARPFMPLAIQLVSLKYDLELPFQLSDAKLGPIDVGSLRQFFTQMGFRRHQADLEKLQTAPRDVVPQAAKATAARLGADDDGFADSLFGSMPDASPQAATVVETGMATSTDCDYRAITTQSQLDELVRTLAGQKMISVDTETIGLGHRAKLCGISLAWKPRAGVYIPICSPDPASHLELPAVAAALHPVLGSPDIPKCGHNLKYDVLVLQNAGVTMRGVAFDSMIASFLLGLPGHGLDVLARTQLQHQNISIGSLIGPARSDTGRRRPQKTMDQVELEAITRYASEDADIALRLYELFAPKLKVMGLDRLAAEIEMPLVEVLAEMEHAGIRVDAAELDRQRERLSARIIELRDLIHERCGEPFNIDSPRQLAEILFTRLGLPVVKKTQTGPSTDIEVLEKLAELDGLDPQQAAIPALIVEYRQLTKLVSTYLLALRDSIDPSTERVHATFHQTGAATGRLSSSGPNLQNIPIRTDEGRLIRKAFIAEPHDQLISADYSQIELRILAHLSRDPALIEAFERGTDIHSTVAAQVFNVNLADVTPTQRNHAKVINFGIIYGITPYGLSRRIEGLSVEAARELITNYRRRFAGIDAFLHQCVEQAERHGYVTTMFARRRAITQIGSRNPQMRALGERLAINSVVQGSAADLIKLAMVNLHRRIEREKLPLRILLQIHDELVCESPRQAATEMAEIVIAEMEQAMSLRVPLKVEAGIGADWYSAK